MSLNQTTLPSINPPKSVRLQSTNIVLPDSAVTLTVPQVAAGVLSMTPSAPRIVTFPDADEITTTFPNMGVSDGFLVVIRNLSGANNITIAVPASGTLNVTTAVVSAGPFIRKFMLRLDSVTPGSESYTIYDIVQ